MRAVEKFSGSLLACPFRKDFLEALAIEGKLGACVLSHLFRNLEPVHSHAIGYSTGNSMV